MLELDLEHTVKQLKGKLANAEEQTAKMKQIN
jgi:hypothetical protein